MRVRSFPGFYFKKQGLSLSGRRNILFYFDPLGRILYVYEKDKGYRIGVSGDIIEKGRVNNRRYIKRFFSVDFVKEVYKKAREIVEKELDILNKNRLIDFLRKGEENFYNSIKEFKNIYTKVSIVPPDVYLCVYIKLTEGCSYNKCTFCNFYKDIDFKVFKKEELEYHVKRVKYFFKEALFSRKHIFLGDANALLIKDDILFDYIDFIKREFREYPNLRSITSFLDVWTGEKKEENFWKNLREKGVFRVYIGLESGSQEVLDILKKPFKIDRFLHLFYMLKESGISVGVIILLGIVERDLEKIHIEETRKLLLKLPFEKNDILYLSPYYTSSFSLNEELVEKEKEFFYSLCFKKRPRIAVYDIREFVY